MAVTKRLPNAPAGRHPTRCGDYEIVRYLAAGGMADLYLARLDSGFYVVKRIAERYADIRRIVDMFADEGRIAKSLDHPNIVRIVETGQADGIDFIAMEYIPGRDLLHICRRAAEVQRTIPQTLAAALVLQVARGLVHAHEKRGSDGKPLAIVHCDVSPGNVVVSWRGTAKIVDFGIARAAIQLRDDADAVAGKYNYMAPEQIRGEAIDGSADVFSLGVILYELTVGKRLFRGRPEEVMHKVLEAPIRKPTAIDPGFPTELEAIILRAIERDRAARYPTARALWTDLRRYLDKAGVRGGKRELALFLREIYAAEKLQESNDFTAPADDVEAQFGELDEQGTRLQVDEDEPHDLPAPETDRRADVVRRFDPTAETVRMPLTSPHRLAPILAMSLIGIAVLVVLSFLLFH